MCRYAVDIDASGDDHGIVTIDLPILPPPGTPFNATIADSEWEKEFIEKLRHTSFPQDDIPWIMDIRYRGPVAQQESQDPDEVDAKAFLNRTFPTRGTIKDFAWALDTEEFRGVGIRKQESDWKVYGLYYGTANDIRAAIAVIANKFKLANLPWHIDEESPGKEFNRRFMTLIPLHLLDGAGHEDVSYPPGYLIRT